MVTIERIKKVFGEALHNLSLIQRHQFFEEFMRSPEYKDSGVSCRRISYLQLEDINGDKCFSIACHDPFRNECYVMVVEPISERRK